MNFLGKILAFILIAMLCIQGNSQTLSFKKSVLVEAETQNNPAAIQLQWNADFNNEGYKIFKRVFGDKEWGQEIASLPLNSNSYFDILVQENVVYEYKIEKETIFGTAYGYICSAVEFQGFEFKGKMLCLVDESLVDNIPEAINQYRLDMALNGWRTELFPISTSTNHFEIKEIIQNNLEDLGHDMILILGDVAVPYSGNVNPDGIPQHKGAWPCDGYYGELDGIWTDGVVFTILNDERNHNIPTDGKFDQAEFPNDVEIPVGRIDFSNLSSSEGEYYEWTAAYLNKLHNFRTGNFYPNKGCIIQDELSDYSEAYAQNAWKNAAPIVGADNIEEGPYRNSLLNDSYFIAYANGIGSFDSCEDVINTQQLKEDSLTSIVSILYGSYFGDWDSPDNLLMATLLNGNTLSSIWAGRPNWQIHSMAMGYPIGHSLVNIQNNNSLNYNSGIASKGIHISLLGDPSLEAFPAQAIEELQVSYDGAEATITWSAYDNPALETYHIYELIDYELIPVAVVDPDVQTYTISCLDYNVPQTFIVRASFIEETKSGTYINYSIGQSIEITNTVFDWAVSASFEYTQMDGTIQFTNLSDNASEYQWFINGELLASSVDFEYTGELETTVNVELVSLNDCQQDLYQEEILITSTKHPESLVSWKMYPNPAINTLYIEGLNQVGVFRILNTNGVVQIEQVVQSGQLEISIKDLTPGIYLIQFQSKESKQIKKLIVL